MRGIITFAIFLFFSGTCLANSNVSGAKITTVMQDSNFEAYMFIGLDIEPTGRPACHTHPTLEYVINLNSDFGKKVQSLALAAKMAGSNVTIVGAGSNNCNSNGIELLRRLQID